MKICDQLLRMSLITFVCSSSLICVNEKDQHVQETKSKTKNSEKLPKLFIGNSEAWPSTTEKVANGSELWLRYKPVLRGIAKICDKTGTPLPGVIFEKSKISLGQSCFLLDRKKMHSVVEKKTFKIAAVTLKIGIKFVDQYLENPKQNGLWFWSVICHEIGHLKDFVRQNYKFKRSKYSYIRTKQFFEREFFADKFAAVVLGKKAAIEGFNSILELIKKEESEYNEKFKADLEEKGFGIIVSEEKPLSSWGRLKRWFRSFKTSSHPEPSARLSAVQSLKIKQPLIEIEDLIAFTKELSKELESPEKVLEEKPVAV